jgi:cobalt-zinc-cadmium efflux system outer membrane protein
VSVSALFIFGVTGEVRNALGGPAMRAFGLQQALQMAEQGNYDLRSAAADLESALGQLHTAGQFPNPTLGLSSSKYKLTQPNGTSLGNSLRDRSYDSIASIGQLVELGGKRSQRRSSAESAVAAARARFDDVRRLVNLSVTKAYVSAVLADSNCRVLEDSAGSLRREASIAAARLEAGDISTADRDQIEVAAAQLELSARSAANAAVAARIQLQNLLGDPDPRGQIVLTDNLARLGQTPVGISAPTNPRPDVVAAKAALDKTAADLSLEKAGRIPDPTFQLQYEREPTDTLNSLGFAVSVPLPLPGYNAGAVRVARAARLQAATKLDQVQAAARAEFATAHAAFLEADARARRYESQIRPKAQHVYETVSFAYENGGANLRDLLAAQRAANDVRVATLQAQADRATAAAALATALSQPIRPAQTSKSALP